MRGLKITRRDRYYIQSSDDAAEVACLLKRYDLYDLPMIEKYDGYRGKSVLVVTSGPDTSSGGPARFSYYGFDHKLLRQAGARVIRTAFLRDIDSLYNGLKFWNGNPSIVNKDYEKFSPRFADSFYFIKNPYSKIFKDIMVDGERAILENPCFDDEEKFLHYYVPGCQAPGQYNELFMGFDAVVFADVLFTGTELNSLGDYIKKFSKIPFYLDHNLAWARGVAKTNTGQLRNRGR